MFCVMGGLHIKIQVWGEGESHNGGVVVCETSHLTLRYRNVVMETTC